MFIKLYLQLIILIKQSAIGNTACQRLHIMQLATHSYEIIIKIYFIRKKQPIVGDNAYKTP